MDLPAALEGRSPREARVVDASLVGCLLRCDTDLDAGAVVDLLFELPDGPVRTKARVAQSYLEGVQFLGLAAADEPRLRSFLELQSRRRTGEGEPG